LFTDNVIIVSQGNDSSIRNIERLLRGFFLLSGLKVNQSSLYGIWWESADLQSMATIMKCNVGCFPFSYLGLRVGANMNLIHNWDLVVEVFKAHLQIGKQKVSP